MDEKIYKTGFYNTGLTKDDVQDIIDNTPNIKNVQADWNETNNTNDSFIKNKPFYVKNVTDSSFIYKVCSFVRLPYNSTNAGVSLEVQFRYGNNSAKGFISYKDEFSLYLYKVGNISPTRYIRFYFFDTGSVIEIYAVATNTYVSAKFSPSMNNPKSQINFDDFGTDLNNLPIGATEITPRWVASTDINSGDIPVKVDGFGNLTPVTMDNYPISQSTGLVNSGKMYEVFTDDNGDQMTETPPQQVYVTGKFYFVAGKVCRCTAYSAASATFDIYGVVEALNYVLSQT